MRIRIAMITWEYPKERVAPEPEVLDLRAKGTMMSLVLAFGNGIILEARAEAETREGVEALRGLAVGTGGCVRIEPTEAERSRLWMFEEGYECYRQGEDAFVFLSPEPRPELF